MAVLFLFVLDWVPTQGFCFFFQRFYDAIGAQFSAGLRPCCRRHIAHTHTANDQRMPREEWKRTKEEHDSRARTGADDDGDVVNKIQSHKMWADKLLMACARKNLAVESKSVRCRSSSHLRHSLLVCPARSIVALARSTIVFFPILILYTVFFASFYVSFFFRLGGSDVFLKTFLKTNVCCWRNVWPIVVVYGERCFRDMFFFFIVFPVNLPWNFDVRTALCLLRSYVHTPCCVCGGYSRASARAAHIWRAINVMSA